MIVLEAIVEVVFVLGAIAGVSTFVDYGLRQGSKLSDWLHPPKPQTVVFEHRAHPEHLAMVTEGLLEMGSLPVTRDEAEADARRLLGVDQ